MTCGIYKIESPSGKKYIGSSHRVEYRFKEHKRMLRRGNHDCEALQHAYNKYGKEALHFAILFECERSQLLKCEQWCINWFGHRHLYNPSRRLYNASMIAGKVEMTPAVRAKISAAKQNPSADTRAKMSASARAAMTAERRAEMSTRQSAAMTAERRAEMSAANMGHKHTDEERAKQSAAQMGRKPSDATRAKLSAAARNRSPEHRAKLGAARKGSKHTDAARAKIGAAGRGRKVSAATRAKHSIAGKGRKQSPDTIAKRTATRRANRLTKLEAANAELQAAA